jgi:biopolymer transport protein ExbD
MKIRHRKQFAAEVSTSSLNDIMFFLLLFFLIISTVTNPAVIKVALPKSDTKPSVNRTPISLVVTEDKRYFINRDQVPFSQLEAALLKQTANEPDPTVVVHVPAVASVQDLVDVIQIGARNKIRMVLATKKPD